MPYTGSHHLAGAPRPPWWQRLLDRVVRALTGRR